jgi:hypothetical protein
MANNLDSALETTGKKGLLSINHRIASLDILRGIAMMFTIFFHSSIYNYKNISSVVVNQQSFIVRIMSTFAIWGGIFILLSMVINSIMLLRRNHNDFHNKHFRFLLIAGIMYLVIHFVLILFIGRNNNDILNNQPDISLVSTALANRPITQPIPMKLITGSSMSTIAINLIVMTFILRLVFRKFKINFLPRYVIGFGLVGLLILIISFTRVTYFYIFQQAKESTNYLAGIPLAFIFAHPYPLLPYLAYAFFGSMLGILIYFENTRQMVKTVLPFGLSFILVGITGMCNFEWTIAKPDFYWYFKTIFELGVFLLLVVLLTVAEPKIKFLNKIMVVKWFSWFSLSIFLLETTISNIFSVAWSFILPAWNQSILGCVAFGFFNVIVWIGILSVWRKVDFKYSFEFFWVKVFRSIGKHSTKMSFLDNSPRY